MLFAAARCCGHLCECPSSSGFPFIIPSTYHRQSAAEDIVDAADANHYAIGANFVHRATYIQQLVTNKYHEHMDLLLEQAVQKDPTPLADISIGEHVMIDWPLNRVPSPQHPLLRGPYTASLAADSAAKAAKDAAVVAGFATCAAAAVLSAQSSYSSKLVVHEEGSDGLQAEGVGGCERDADSDDGQELPSDCNTIVEALPMSHRLQLCYGS